MKNTMLVLMVVLGVFTLSGCQDDSTPGKEESTSTEESGSEEDTSLSVSSESSSSEGSGTDSSSGSSSESSTGGDSCVLPDFEETQATYYEVGAQTFCGPNTLPEGVDGFAALRTDLFDDSRLCGSCAEVRGLLGTAIVLVADQCIGCSKGVDLDLDANVAAKITGKPNGYNDVEYRWVPCPFEDGMRYETDGTNPWYINVRVTHHRTPIGWVYLETESGWVSLNRTSWNYWNYPGSITTPIPGPLHLRVEDIFMEVVEETDVPFMNTGEIYVGSAQFGYCQL